MINKTQLATILLAAQLAGAAFAQQNSPGSSSTDSGSKLHWQFSPYTYHYTPDDAHKNVWMLGLEREQVGGKVDGITFFSNSFGQPCVYIYPWGETYHGIAGIQSLSFKWTAGLLYGYKDAYEDKVPYNHNGFSPAIIPALEYEFKPGLSVQVDLLGTAAMMFQVNMPFK